MILFVTAFDSEARPLIDHFRLKRQADHGFPVYAGEDVWLVVSGPGKVNAAAATAHLHGRAGFPYNNTWINLGIAGHAELAQGEARLVHKITDENREQVWYPSMVVSTPWESLALRSVDQPDTSYETDDLIDMEASGFIHTALRFSCAELVHVIKVISDNRNNPAAIPKPAQVHEWIKPHLADIDSFCNALEKLAYPLETPEIITQEFNTLTAKMHFTTSQQNRLQHLLQQWYAMHPDEVLPETVSTCSNSKQLLKSLQRQIDNSQLVLP
jgi:hypothetical protein